MINQWCIVKKSRINDKLKDKSEPRLLNSGQYLVRVTDNNTHLLNGYRRYDLEDLRDTNLDKKSIHIEKDSSNEPFKSKNICNGHSLFKRNHGLGSLLAPTPDSGFIDISPNNTEVLEMEIGYDWAKIEAMEIIGAGKKHFCNLYIIDTKDGDYSGEPYSIVNQFCFGVAVAEGFHRFSSKYDGDLFLGMAVQLEITNFSDIATSVALNIELNEVVK